jgi:hypothetical protein
MQQDMMSTPNSTTDLLPSRHTSAVAVLIGAVTGGLAGYLLLTPEGRQVCRAIGAALEDVAAESARFANSLRRAQSALSSSWDALSLS